MERLRGFVICTTQRSGSNYLCQLLTSTGDLGRPLDYFNAVGRRAKGWTDYPDDPIRQLELIPTHGATPNGIYGFKAFAEALDVLTSVGWTQRLPGLCWVHLHRADLLGQAISLVIAKQTGAWRSNAASYGAPSYDAAAIAAEMTGLARDEARWRVYFANNGIQPVEVSYEALVDDPQSAVEAVASLMSLGVTAKIDPSRIDVAIQRDDVNREWRERFLARPAVLAVAGFTRRPRLTVSIISKNGQERLPRLLAEARAYADEIIVGVDAASRDRTLDVASAGANVVYQFRLAQPGQLAPARLLPFDYATGDWILSLDDDEGMEDSFDALVPELMGDAVATHYYFPRKWIVGENPDEYVHAPPWFPNWSPRMFRNDRSLAWKSPLPHSMYQVQGAGYYDARACIVHFEPVWCTPERRREKVAEYRNAGAYAQSEEHYTVPPDAYRRPVRLRTPRPAPPAREPAVVHQEIRDLVARQYPPWSATFVTVDMPKSARPGETFVVQATVRNSGTMAWTQQNAQWPAAEWPLLRLSCRLFYDDGRPAEPHDGPRIVLPRFAAPGEEITFIDSFTAPERPGEYVLAWDMLSEGCCWFEQCGSVVYRSRLGVREEVAEQVEALTTTSAASPG